MDAETRQWRGTKFQDEHPTRGWDEDLQSQLAGRAALADEGVERTDSRARFDRRVSSMLLMQKAKTEWSDYVILAMSLGLEVVFDVGVQGFRWSIQRSKKLYTHFKPV